MAEEIIDIGDKVHVITRRLFESDVRRHFAGEVTGLSGDLQEVTGYVFVFNAGKAEFEKRPELRTRIFSLGQQGFIVNKIPRDVVIDSLMYLFIDRRLVITDGADFALDILEFGPHF